MDAKTKAELLSSISEDELEEFREIFGLVDRDGGGSISKSELAELLDTLGVSASKDEIDLMVSEIDEDGNAEIDFEEFVIVMSRRVNTQYTPAQIKQAFKVFQDAGSPPGKIHIDRVVLALTTFGTRKLSAEAARELALQMEPDAEGWINFNSFVEAIAQ